MYSEYKNKLRWLIKLPYNHQTVHPYTNNTEYCINIFNNLNNKVYGLSQPKEYVLEVINNRLHNSSSKGILALKGPPGVGKTQFARSAAEAMGLPFGKISLGGVIDVTLLKGSDTVWSGAHPSKIIELLADAQCNNMVILLDEIDKISDDHKGIDVSSALLHLLDQNENKQYEDMYLNEITHNISNVFFIVAMNDDTTLHPALKDRLNIIELKPYTRNEIIEIIHNYSLPKSILDKGFQPNDISITNQACETLLNNLGNQIKINGIRSVERSLDSIVSKLNMLKTLNGQTSIKLSYSLPDFKGLSSLPYVITSDTVNRLCPVKHEFNHLSMYS